MKKYIEFTFIIILVILLLTSGVQENKTINMRPASHILSPGYDSIRLKNMIEVDSFHLAILPPASGVQFYKNQIIFLSASKNERKMAPEQISFGTVEAYIAPIEDTISGRHSLFSTTASFTYPIDGITFNADYDTLYYSKITKKERREKIFMARLLNSKKGGISLVTDSVPLKFCSENYSYSHPTLSSEGNMMIFASDMVGSAGGMDLFISRRNGGRWSAPVNLGKDINTARNEFYPFLDNDNNLYFSSDGLPGYGGYDIFTCKFNGSGWDKPENLSDRINSPNDDIAFTINKSDGKTAFFTRRKTQEKGEMQLFRVDISREATDFKTLTLALIFNGKKAIEPSLTTAYSDTTVSNAAESQKRVTANVSEQLPDLRKPSKKTVTKPTGKENGSKLKSEIAKNAEVKTASTKPSIVSSSDRKPEVIYRVQLLTSEKPGQKKEITLNGKTYALYEYFYKGAYRYTIGEFTTLAPAAAMQRACRQGGYHEAFVAAFVNNIRSNDLKLFK